MLQLQPHQPLQVTPQRNANNVRVSHPMSWALETYLDEKPNMVTVVTMGSGSAAAATANATSATGGIAAGNSLLQQRFRNKSVKSTSKPHTGLISVISAAASSSANANVQHRPPAPPLLPLPLHQQQQQQRGQLAMAPLSSPPSPPSPPSPVSPAQSQSPGQSHDELSPLSLSPRTAEARQQSLRRIKRESLTHGDEMVYTANDPKPWTCRNCQRKYKWKNSLNCHIKNECGKPPKYFCERMCGYKTNINSNLKRHLNSNCKPRQADDVSN